MNCSVPKYRVCIRISSMMKSQPRKKSVQKGFKLPLQPLGNTHLMLAVQSLSATLANQKATQKTSMPALYAMITDLWSRL